MDTTWVSKMMKREKRRAPPTAIAVSVSSLEKNTIILYQIKIYHWEQIKIHYGEEARIQYSQDGNMEKPIGRGGTFQWRYSWSRPVWGQGGRCRGRHQCWRSLSWSARRNIWVRWSVTELSYWVLPEMWRQSDPQPQQQSGRMPTDWEVNVCSKILN